MKIKQICLVAVTFAITIVAFSCENSKSKHSVNENFVKSSVQQIKKQDSSSSKKKGRIPILGPAGSQGGSESAMLAVDEFGEEIIVISHRKIDSNFFGEIHSALLGVFDCKKKYADFEPDESTTSYSFEFKILKKNYTRFSKCLVYKSGTESKDFSKNSEMRKDCLENVFKGIETKLENKSDKLKLQFEVVLYP